MSMSWVQAGEKAYPVLSALVCLPPTLHCRAAVPLHVAPFLHTCSTPHAAALQGRRVRHVERQSSAVNLGTRMAPAELKRLSAEADYWREQAARLAASTAEQLQAAVLQTRCGNGIATSG